MGWHETLLLFVGGVLAGTINVLAGGAGFMTFPLLVAAYNGQIMRPDGGPPRLSAVFRNGFVMALSNPLYSFVLLAVLAPLGTLLLISGVGAALLGAGTLALVSTRATRDHLIRFGLLPPDQDPDESIRDDAWRMRDI